MSLLEQRLLWTAFTLSLYGFLHASECLSLVWSNIILYNDHISITLHQSKTDSFQRGAMHNYNNMVNTKQQSSSCILGRHNFTPVTSATYRNIASTLISGRFLLIPLRITQLQDWSSHHSSSSWANTFVN